MPATQDVKSMLEAKPINFTIKTAGGKWACTMYGDRNAYEKTVGTPAISRNNSSTSTSSMASSSSSSSSH